MRSIVDATVGRRKRCGRELRSTSPAAPSAPKRLTHLLTVLRQTPKAVATAFVVCPAMTRPTMISRPAGVSGAFSWTSIRSPRARQSVSSFSLLGPDRIDNRLEDHT
jgi:hypothetical protein